MLGVDYKSIHCMVKNCVYNETHCTRDVHNKVIDVRYICEKESGIVLGSDGKCQSKRLKKRKK